MNDSEGKRRRTPLWRGSLTIIAIWYLLSVFPVSDLAAAQKEIVPSLIITPTAVTLPVDDSRSFSAIDASGRPVRSAQWSISAPIAELQIDGGEVRVDARHAGRAVLTVTADNFSAAATVTILAGERLPPGSLRWSVDPMPGFETLVIQQTSPAQDSQVDFYSIEWNKESNAIVRAFRNTGQQLWMTRLSSMASPATLKHTLPEMGQLYLNKTRINDMSQLLIGRSNFVLGSANGPIRGLPVDGKSILVRMCGGNWGDLVFLERGRFRDSLVSLSPVDGSERWRFRSEGRLAKDWTIDFRGDVGIVETLPNPISSALLTISGTTGTVRYRTPFPESSSTINGFRCQDPIRNVLTNIRPSRAGSVFTNTDGNMYLQVETHVESTELEACKGKQYSFDDTLALLRVSPDGEAEWKTFERIHADGAGDFTVQARVFAGETIPDGLGGVLAAWTYGFPGTKEGEKAHFEARLSRIGDKDQADFTLPMPFWTPGITSLFDENMVLGEGDALYATNRKMLVRFNIPAGEVSWVRQPPTGEVELQFAAAGGGVVVSNAGQLSHFDVPGNGQPFPATVKVSNPNDIGLAQFDPFDHTPSAPLQLRSVSFYGGGSFLGVEDGAPDGRGTIALVQF
jgi:hypothetical protein